MSTLEEVDFEFITNSSGSFEGLLDRLDVKQDDAVLMALTYYAIYVHGEFKGGRKLVMIDPKGESAWELDDELTEDHVRADFLTVNVDKGIVENLTRHANVPDPTDTLTRAFILLEKICDVRDTGWGVGLFDKETSVIDRLVMKGGVEEPIEEATEKIVKAMAPGKLIMH